jgi:hypothetical protein
MCQIDQLKVRMKKCDKQEQAVGIQWKDGHIYWLCNNCWEKLSDKDWEIGDSKVMVEEIFGRREKEEAEAVLTEYKYRGKEVETEIIEETDEV